MTGWPEKKGLDLVEVRGRQYEDVFDLAGFKGGDRQIIDVTGHGGDGRESGVCVAKGCEGGVMLHDVISLQKEEGPHQAASSSSLVLGMRRTICPPLTGMRSRRSVRPLPSS